MTALPLNIFVPFPSVWIYWMGEENADALVIFLDRMTLQEVVQAFRLPWAIWSMRTTEKTVHDLTHGSPSAMLSFLPCKICMPRPGLGLYTEHPLEVHQYMMQISWKELLLHHYQLSGTERKFGEYSPALEPCLFKCSFNWIQSSSLLGQVVVQSHLLCSCCILLLLHGSISAVFGRGASACHSITPSFGILPSGTHHIRVQGYY